MRSTRGGGSKGPRDPPPLTTFCFTRFESAVGSTITTLLHAYNHNVLRIFDRSPQLKLRPTIFNVDHSFQD